MPLEDFRSRLQPQKVLSAEDIDRLLRTGLVADGIRACRNSGLQLDRFKEAIESGCRRMYLGCRAGELLSLVAKHGLDTGFSAAALLMRVYECHDYHTLLKQACRFRTWRGLEEQLVAAIEALEQRGRREEALSWKSKLVALGAPRELFESGRDQ